MRKIIPALVAAMFAAATFSAYAADQSTNLSLRSTLRRKRNRSPTRFSPAAKPLPPRGTRCSLVPAASRQVATRRDAVLPPAPRPLAAR